MALPHRRQALAKFIHFHDMSREGVAAALRTNPIRVSNLCKGGTYPSPNEIDALERLFGLPIEVLFEADMLVYRNGPWPPPRGAVALRRELDRMRSEAGE